MFWNCIYPAGLLVGQVAATLTWGWAGYRAFMWTWLAWHLIYTSATADDRLDSGGMTMLSAALSMLALAVGTWLVWDVVGDYLPGSALGVVLEYGGFALGGVYAVLGVVVEGPVALLWLLRRVAPRSFITRAAFGAAERAAVYAITDDVREARQLHLSWLGTFGALTTHRAIEQRREPAVR